MKKKKKDNENVRIGSEHQTNVQVMLDVRLFWAVCKVENVSRTLHLKCRYYSVIRLIEKNAIGNERELETLSMFSCVYVCAINPINDPFEEIG